MGDAKLVWIDLETTGLDARLDAPLEVGLKITDGVGFVFAEMKTLLWEPNIDYRRSMERAMKNDFVRDMHEKSGLFDDLKGASLTKLMRYEAQMKMIEFLVEHGATGLPLAGSSIGSLDRPFCLEHFPDFNKNLSYRNVDISTLKEICKLVNPTLYENLVPIIGTKKDSKHRVLDDIDASIVEYRAYLDNFLFTEED